MLRYLVWVLSAMLLLMTCKGDFSKASIQAGTHIKQSTQFDQDTIFWSLTAEQLGLIIDTPKDLVLDFKLVLKDSFLLDFEYLGKPTQRFGKPYKPLDAYLFKGQSPENKKE